MDAIKTLEQKHRKTAVPPVRSGDTVRVHQRIKEGGKTRIQVFEGVVIRTHRLSELTACITVRRIASGVGVEKTYLLHSPNVAKLEIVRRAKVRRNFLSYLRNRRGKSARLSELGFDKAVVNANATAEVEEIVPELAEASPEAELTELNEETTSEVAEVSTEEVAKEENQAAASEDAATDTDAAEDEQQLASEETEAGVEKADESA